MVLIQPSGENGSVSTDDARDVIERDIFINATLERVWSLVSKVGFWVGDELRFDVDACVGQVALCDAGRHGQFPVRVERLEPPRYAAYRWASAFPGEQPTEHNSTLVEFSLTERDGGVQLRLRESGFAALAGAPAVRLAAWNDNRGGWTEQLRRLRAAAAGVPAQ